MRRSAAACCLSLMLVTGSAVRGAQPQPEDLALRLERVGMSTTVLVVGSWNTWGDVQGWSWGVCHDPAEAQIECPTERVDVCESCLGTECEQCSAVECTEDLATADRGTPPDFLSVNVYENGIAQGVVLSFL